MTPLILFLYHEPTALASYHFRCLRESQPDLRIVPLCSQFDTPFKGYPCVVETGHWPRRDPWQTSDRLIYDWCLQSGDYSSYESLVIVEHDMLVLRSFRELFRPCSGDVTHEFQACRVNKWPDPTWGWWSKPAYFDSGADYGRLQPYLRGVVPFTGIWIGRKVLESAMVHLLHDPLMALMHNEMRLATAASKAGYEAVEYGVSWVSSGDQTAAALELNVLPPFCHPMKVIADLEWTEQDDG